MSPAPRTWKLPLMASDGRAETTTPVLAATGVTKRFGPVEALRDVDFELHAGEVVALVGDNGAGKSTLVKAIAGIYRPDAGRIFFKGREVRISNPNDATNLGIATVYQYLALCDNLDVVANLFLGQEQIATGGGIPDASPGRERRQRQAAGRI
jgi:D-xylose transport system ATP-binding protein